MNKIEFDLQTVDVLIAVRSDCHTAKEIKEWLIRNDEVEMTIEHIKYELAALYVAGKIELEVKNM